MSEAEKLERLLDKERSKPIPDEDVVYAIKQRLPYANTIDRDKLKNGNDKIARLLKSI